jgi:hypothetical protein
MISQFYSLYQQATVDFWNNRLLLEAEFSNIVSGVFHSGGGEVLAPEPLNRPHGRLLGSYRQPTPD